MRGVACTCTLCRQSVSLKLFFLASTHFLAASLRLSSWVLLHWFCSSFNLRQRRIGHQPLDFRRTLHRFSLPVYHWLNTMTIPDYPTCFVEAAASNNTVFVDTSLGTHLAMAVSDGDTVFDVKGKLLLSPPVYCCRAYHWIHQRLIDFGVKLMHERSN